MLTPKLKKADFKRFEEDLIKREFRKSIIEDNSLEIQSKFDSETCKYVFSYNYIFERWLAFCRFSVALHTMQIKRMVNTRFTPAGNMKVF